MNRDEQETRKIDLDPRLRKDYEELLERFRNCKSLPCNICNHTGCGWCPDCSPQVPEWD